MTTTTRERLGYTQTEYRLVLAATAISILGLLWVPAAIMIWRLSSSGEPLHLGPHATIALVLFLAGCVSGLVIAIATARRRRSQGGEQR